MPDQLPVPQTIAPVLADQAATAPKARAPYRRPTLQPLGSWNVVTLQQSIPIFP